MSTGSDVREVTEGAVLVREVLFNYNVSDVCGKSEGVRFYDESCFCERD